MASTVSNIRNLAFLRRGLLSSGSEQVSFEQVHSNSGKSQEDLL